MTDTEDSRTTNQAPPYVSMQSLELKFNDDQEIYDRLVSDVSNVVSCDDKSDPDYKSPTDWSNRWCKKTLLPRLVFNDQLFLPIETCARLIGLKQAIEQDEQRKEAQRNYVPSPALTEAELYLRLETIWWLDKSTGAVSVDAERVKMKEANDQLGWVESLDFDFEDIPDGVYVFDSNEPLGDGENLNDEPEATSEEDAPKKKSKEKGKCGKVRKCELYKTVRGRKYNSKQVGLCWYYE